MVRTLAVLVALISTNTSLRAQPPDELMRRVGGWVQTFVDQLTNVVAEEEYVPRVRSLGPRLRSDYLLVRYPGSTASWQTFRDVVAIDGASLRNQPERLSKLFLEPFDNAVEQANAIKQHSARYLSPLSDPLLGIAILQRQYQPRFHYTVGGLDRGMGPGVRQITFEEVGTPTILRADGNRDLPTRGTAWAVEATGRIVRTDLQIGQAKDRVRAIVLSTAFKEDENLHIAVPATMQDGYMMKDSTNITGTAYYTRFRRFSIRTVETIAPPKP